MNDGLLTAEGQQWLQNRRKLQPTFHRKEVEKLNGQIADVVDRKTARIKSNREVELQPLFLEWTRDILIKSFFGVEAEDVEGLQNIHSHLWTLRQHANDRMKNPLKPPLSWPTQTNRQFKIAVSELETMIKNLLRSSAARKEENKFLQLLLEEKRNGSWTDKQIFDEILTLFLAGQETTTNAMVFLVHSMIEHPEIVHRLKDPEDPLQWPHVIREVLRLSPPAWALSREARNDDWIQGEKIKAGTTLFLSIYAMHRHPSLWSAPNDFRPDRFLSEEPKNAYLPFGLGPRVCIGNHFALMEMEIMAKKLFESFDIIRDNDYSFELITPITMSLKQPYCVRLVSK